MLLTNKVYTPEALKIATKIAQETEIRHAKWMISMKHLLDQSEVDGLLSLQGKYCDDVIFDESQRITRNQRILLDCEQARVTERQKKVEDRQATLKSVVIDVSKATEKAMVKKLLHDPIDKLFSGIPPFDHLASFAYGPSLSFSKLGTLTTLSHQLSSSVMDLVSNPRFCDRIGKSVKQATDAKMAIGQIGIENCRMLFPVLMARPMLKWSDKNTKLIAPKMWQHLIVTSNVTRMRLQEAGVKEPDSGILLGVLRCLGQFLVANHFTHTFEDELINTMLKYREADQRDEYYACADVVANTAFLPKLIFELEGELSRRVIESFDWPAVTLHLKQAVLEDIDRIPIADRSLYGAALGQGRAYSIYDGMERSSAFVEKHKPYWFANVQISGAALKEIKLQSPGKLALTM